MLNKTCKHRLVESVSACGCVYNLKSDLSGSVEMEKLREAVLGKNGRNLDDLPQMDGMDLATKCLFPYIS